MIKQHVDYDQIAPVYDRRFASDEPTGTGEALVALAEELKANRLLEVGCGTGRWLAELQPIVQELYGLDLSAGMLSQARERSMPAKLVRGYARRTPFQNSFFDLAFCVNAIHHFEDPRGFIKEALRVLRPGGALAIVGNDPRGRKDSWYVYHYFEGTWETDLMRFPTWETVSDWMREVGFERLELREVERIHDPKRGREVLDDPFLEKHACSQLALLTDEAYRAGLRRIESALARAEARGEPLVFQVDISIAILTSQLRNAEKGVGGGRPPPTDPFFRSLLV
ncbi:MAG: putative methyltransferase YcgJ [Anaerolineales bacterium]|nr:putative methyltransferase YcgJ [Anaerolineales bacterium]